MAGDWIKMGKDLLTHPKVVRMASALNADRLRTVGGLFAVWCLFDTHSTDGQLSGYTPKVVDELTGFPGLADAMTSVGWLESDESGVVLPDFSEHNGQSAKRRAQEADRKRMERNASASDADKKRTREEKRREEVIPPATTAGAGAGDAEVIAITEAWLPSDRFKVQAKLQGLPVLNAEAMAEGLLEFIAYWIARPNELRTQSEWEHALVKSLKHRQVKAASQPAGPARVSAARTPNHGAHDVEEPA